MGDFWKDLVSVKRYLITVSLMLPTAVCGAVAPLTKSPYMVGVILGISVFLALVIFDAWFYSFYKDYKSITQSPLCSQKETEWFKQNLLIAISVYRLIVFLVFLGLLLPFLKGAVVLTGLLVVLYSGKQMAIFLTAFFVTLIPSIIGGVVIRRRCKPMRDQVFGFIPKPKRRSLIDKVKSLFQSKKGINILLLLLVFFLFPINSFAFDPKHVEFYTYGGFDAVDSAFKFIALIFSDKNYQGLFYTIMVLSLFFAGASSYFRFLQGRQEGNILSWAGPVLIAFVLFVAFVLPKGEVTVYDKVLNKQDTISGIPIGITTVAGLTSEVGDGILQIIDTTSIDPNMDYENSAGGIGVLTIYNAVTHSLSATDSNFDRSMRRYIEDCYFFCLEKPQGCNLNDLENSTDLLTNELGNAASPSVYTVYYDNSNPQGTTLTCKDDWNNYLRATLNNTTTYQADAKMICAEAGVDVNNLTAFRHCLDVTEAYLQKLYNGQYPSVTDSVYTYLEQDYIAQQIYDATVESNASILNNYEIGNGGISIGMAFNTWIPTIRGVVIAFGLSLLPFLILFLPTPFFKKILGVCLGVFLFQISWLVVDAVIHYFLVHEAATLFSSVYVSHGVGYASFLVMQTPLAKALAMWGYLRSLGMGIAAMSVSAVAKVGAYGLQRLAGGLEGAVEAGAIKGEESMNVSEQGRLEDEIMHSNVSRIVNAGMTYSQYREELKNLQEFNIGANKELTDIAEKNHSTVEQLGAAHTEMTTGAEARIARNFNSRNLVDGSRVASNLKAEQTTVGLQAFNKTETTEGGRDRMVDNMVKQNVFNLEKTSFLKTPKDAKDAGWAIGNSEIGGKLTTMNILGNGNLINGSNYIRKTEGRMEADKIKADKGIEDQYNDSEIVSTYTTRFAINEGIAKGIKQQADEYFNGSVKAFTEFTGKWGEKWKGVQAFALQKDFNNYSEEDLVDAEVANMAGKIANAKTDENIADHYLNVSPLVPVAQKFIDAEMRKAGNVNLATPTGAHNISVTPNGEIVFDSFKYKSKDFSIEGVDDKNGQVVSAKISGDIGKALSSSKFKFRWLPQGLGQALIGVKGSAEYNNGMLSIPNATASGRSAVVIGNYLKMHGNASSGEEIATVGKHGGTAEFSLTVGEKGIPKAEMIRTDLAKISEGKQVSAHGGIDVKGLEEKVRKDLLTGNKEDLVKTLSFVDKVAKDGNVKDVKAYEAAFLTKTLVSMDAIKKYTGSELATSTKAEIGSKASTPGLLGVEGFAKWATNRSTSNEKTSAYDKAQLDIFNKLYHSPNNVTMAERAVDIAHNPSKYLEQHGDLDLSKKPTEVVTNDAYGFLGAPAVDPTSPTELRTNSPSDSDVNRAIHGGIYKSNQNLNNNTRPTIQSNVPKGSTNTFSTGQGSKPLISDANLEKFSNHNQFNNQKSITKPSRSLNENVASPEAKPTIKNNEVKTEPRKSEKANPESSPESSIIASSVAASSLLKNPNSSNTNRPIIQSDIPREPTVTRNLQSESQKNTVAPSLETNAKPQSPHLRAEPQKQPSIKNSQSTSNSPHMDSTRPIIQSDIPKETTNTVNAIESQPSQLNPKYYNAKTQEAVKTQDIGVKEKNTTPNIAEPMVASQQQLKGVEPRVTEFTSNVNQPSQTSTNLTPNNLARDNTIPQDNNRPIIQSDILKETVANSINDTNTAENQPHVRTNNSRLQPKEFDINTAKAASGVKTTQQIKANSESNAKSQRNVEATQEMMRQKEPTTMPNPLSNIQSSASMIQNQSSTNPVSTQSLNRSVEPTPEGQSNTQSDVGSTQETDKVESQPLETMSYTPKAKASNQSTKTETIPEVNSHPQPTANSPYTDNNRPTIQSDIPVQNQESVNLKPTQTSVEPQETKQPLSESIRTASTTPESKPLKENATPEVKPSPETPSVERTEAEVVNTKPEPKPEIKVVEPNHQADKVQELSTRQSVSPELKPTVANFETTRNLSTLNNTQPSQPTVDNNRPSIRSDIPNATGFSNEQRVQPTMSSPPFDQNSASNPQAANPNPDTQTVGHGFNFGDFKVKTHERSKNDMKEMLKNIEAMKGNSDLTPNPSQEDLVPHSSRSEPEPEISKDEDMTPTQSR